MKYPVPNVVKQVVLGSLLGDGHIRQKMYKNHPCNAHLIISHCREQKEYLEWKNLLMGPYGGNVLLTSRGQYLLTGKSHPHMNPFMELVGKPKRITRKLLNQLDPLGLAVWYQDDGTLGIEWYKREDGTYNVRRRRIQLATDCFSLKEHWIMQQYFKVVWDIDVAIHKINERQHRLSMNYTNAQKFVKLVEPYIVPCMKYKIDFNRPRVCHNVPPLTGNDIV